MERVEADFDSSIESVRAGTLFAQGKAGLKAYEAWTRKRHRAPGTHVGRGLIGDALEAAVMGIASLFPENVERVHG